MSKKIAKNKLLYSLLLLVVALITTVSVVFGWFVLDDSSTGDFVVTLTSSSAEVGLKINDVDHGGGNLVLENAMPHTEYLFELSVTPSDNGQVKVSLVNPSGSFYDEEFDENGNMCDIMAIRYPITSEEYTRVSQLQNDLIVSDIPVISDVTTYIEFSLFFLDQPPPEKEINIYQGKSFNIEKILIELY